MVSAELIALFFLAISIFEFALIYNLRSKVFEYQTIITAHQATVSHKFSICADCNNTTNESTRNISRDHIKMATPPRTIAGVAVTVFLGSPQWWQNRYSMMINQMLSALPDDWAVQIYYNPSKRMAVEATRYPGIVRQMAKGRVFLTEIPPALQKARKSELLLSPFFWESAGAEAVLLFGGNSVLCANSPLNVSYFLSRGLQLVGSPWRELQGRGGAGGLSLRNRTAILRALHSLQANGQQLTGRGAREDVVLVRALLQRDPSLVAGSELTEQLAMTEARAWRGAFGAVGTLAELDDTQRQARIDYCPELKMMFPSLHSPSCFGADPDVMGCLRYLCNAGGLRCGKTNATVSWMDKKAKRIVSLTVSS